MQYALHDPMRVGTAHPEIAATLHELEVRLVNQDHSLGNMLVDALLAQPGVTHAAYTKRHPQDHAVDLSVTCVHDAHAELVAAVRTCGRQLDDFLARTLGAAGAAPDPEKTVPPVPQEGHEAGPDAAAAAAAAAAP